MGGSLGVIDREKIEVEIINEVQNQLEKKSKIDNLMKETLRLRLKKIKMLGGAFASIEFSEHITTLFQ